MSATKSIPQLNEGLEALGKLLDELPPQVDRLGVCLPDKPKQACEGVRQLLWDPLPVDAPEKDVAAAERNLELLGPMSAITKELADRIEEERRRHKQELNGWKALGQLDQVAPLLAAAKTREGVMKRLTEEAHGLREEKKKLAEEQNRMKGLCKQATAMIARLRQERDRMKTLCAEAAAALKAKAAGGA